MTTTVLPDIPRHLYRQSGPFASVYLDVSRDHENSPREIELRWKELARSLAEQGAYDADVAVIETMVTDPSGEPGSAGRVVIASGGQVRLTEVLPVPPRRDIAHWGTLPHVMPLLAQQPETLAHVVVDLGKTTATVRAVAASGDVSETIEQGREESAHKVRGGGVAYRSIENYTEEVWADNVRTFAKTIGDTVSRVHAQLVIVLGDEQACAMLLAELDARSRSLVVQAHGPGPTDKTTDEGPGGQVERLVAERAAERTREVMDGFDTAHGRDTGLAATGLGPVVTALQQAQVETLVIVDDPSSARQLWVGPEPSQLATGEEDLRTIGAEVLGRDRADAALVRAAAGTGARLVVLPHPDVDRDAARAGSAAGARGAEAGTAPDIADGVGAVLRFSTPTA